MSFYTVAIITKFYKYIQVEAEDQDQAEEKVWNWCDNNDAMYMAEIESELYVDLESDEPNPDLPVTDHTENEDGEEEEEEYEKEAK
jgi:hypothetical protein